MFWTLTLVPTLIISAIAFKLLSHEQDRIHRAAVQALRQRAETVAQTIHITMEAVMDNLQQTLLAFEPEHLEEQLLQWEGQNPLVRNVFIYQDQDLLYPMRGMVSTREERYFITRYDAIFTGRVPFDTVNGAAGVVSAAGEQLSSTNQTGYPPGRYQDNSGIGSLKESRSLSDQPAISSRKRLIELARAPVSRQEVQESEEDSPLADKAGWIPWFSENRLHLLGWVQQAQKGPVYGIELELMALLSRLLVDFPVMARKNAALVLMDGSGRFMHQSGTQSVETGRKPVDIISVSAHLPHWRIALFVADDGFGQGRGFLYLSLMLLAIFIVAIITGGILLTRLTLSNIQDARQKTSFVASVSHELKTPLTSIRMYAELLLSKRVKDRDKTERYLTTIISESGRLARLINNVLDFGKLEQGQKKYQLQPVELDQLLKQIISNHTLRIEKHNLKIRIQIDTGNYLVTTDKDAVEQVILNLIDNGLKYADKGKFIAFKLTEHAGTMELKICDDGPGIPKSHRGRIFEKFYRVDNSLTASQPGSGLGLSIAYRIVQDLGGDLSFEARSPHGCCFVIRINKQ